MEVLAHQLGENALTDAERERMAAALVARAGGLIVEGKELR